MGFNQGNFNNSGFNAGSFTSGKMVLVTARCFVKAQRPLMNIIANLLPVFAAIRTGARFDMRVIRLIGLRGSGIVTGAGFALTVKFYIFLKKAEVVFRKRAVYVRLFEYDVLDLNGIVLNPDETLTIDMDKITADIDGRNVIEFWQTGSRPFYFSKGSNVLTYYDGADERQAEMLIVWRERWL